MKKMIYVLLAAFVMGVSFAACSNKDSKDSDEDKKDVKEAIEDLMSKLDNPKDLDAQDLIDIRKSLMEIQIDAIKSDPSKEEVKELEKLFEKFEKVWNKAVDRVDEEELNKAIELYDRDKELKDLEKEMNKANKEYKKKHKDDKDED